MSGNHGHLSPSSVLPGQQDEDRESRSFSRRARAVMVSLVAVLAVGSGVGMAVLWPTETPAPAVDVSGLYGGVDVVKAVVTSAGVETCPGMPEDRLPDGTIPVTAECAWITAELLSGPDEGETVRVSVARRTTTSPT